MKAEIDISSKYIHLHFDTKLEMDQVEISFTRRIRNWKFRTKGKRWKGDVRFIRGTNKLPIGLWWELKKMCDRFGFGLKLKGVENIMNNSVTLEETYEFFEALLESKDHIDTRDLQVESLYMALKYKFSITHISTAIGKTLLQYVWMIYLFYHKEITKVLIVCPDTDLVIQNYNAFDDFSDGVINNMNMCMVHGGASLKDVSDYRIVIANVQTLRNRKADFFEDFDALIVDECHHAGNNSMQKIFDFCRKKTIRRLGLSGSIKEDRSADIYTVKAELGPVVKYVSKREAINKGYASEIEVKIFKLKYLTLDEKKWLATLPSREEDGEKRFRIEQKIIRESKARLEWVCELISKTPGNTLVFFLDKKGGYGRKIVDGVKRMNNKKEVYYIDGDTPKDNRKLYKNRMEEGTNKVLVATYDTYSTGKSIDNLRYIVCAESRKDERVINQAMGRGMRLHEDKDKCVWIDIADDFKLFIENYDFTNYAMKHLVNRIRYYEKEEFEYDIIDVNLEGNIFS